MVIAIGAETYRQSLEMTFNVYHQTGRILQERGQLAGVADEVDSGFSSRPTRMCWACWSRPSKRPEFTIGPSPV